MSRARRWRVRLLLLAGALALVIVAAEVTYRWALVELYGPETRAANPQLHAILARSRPRILVVGDSICMGTVPPAWPERLRTHAGDRADLVNLSLSGAGFHEYVQRVRTWGARVKPRLIIACANVGNDLWNAYNPYVEPTLVRRLYYGACNRLQVLKLVNARLVAIPAVRSAWWSAAGAEPATAPSAAPAAATDATRVGRPAPHVVQYARDYPRMYHDAITLPAEAATVQLSRIDGLLADLASQARALDSRVALLIVPASAQVHARYYPEFYQRHGFLARPEELIGCDRVQKELARLASTHGIEVLDPLPAMRASPETLFFLDDDHPSPHGQKWLSGWVAEQVLSDPAAW